ncbi:hypothetical protein D3C85_1735920 [compost metagenome]
MTAKVGLPTLRLVRVAIGPWRLDELQPGMLRSVEVSLADLPRTRHAKPAAPARKESAGKGFANGSRTPSAAPKAAPAPRFRFAKKK